MSTRGEPGRQSVVVASLLAWGMLVGAGCIPEPNLPARDQEMGVADMADMADMCTPTPTEALCAQATCGSSVSPGCGLSDTVCECAAITSVTLTTQPQGAVWTVGQRVTLQAQALDAQGEPVARAAITWGYDATLFEEVARDELAGQLVLRVVAPTEVSGAAADRAWSSVDLTASAGEQVATHTVRLRPGWVDVSAGDAHTCAVVAAGDVYCWGDGAFGQTARAAGDTRPAHEPARVEAALPEGYGFVDVEAGEGFTCAVARALAGAFADQIWCWGVGSSGQLGVGQLVPTPTPTPAPVAGIPTNAEVVTLALGAQHACALVRAGAPTPSLYCWGDNSASQITDEGNLNVPGARDVTTVEAQGRALGLISALALGAAHTCVVSGGDAIYCRGQNSEGQITGNVGATVPLTRPSVFTDEVGMPQPKPPNTSSWRALSAGPSHTCAIDDLSRVFCWGQSADGRLGGDPGAGISPAQPLIYRYITQGDLEVDRVEAGGRFTCALSALDGGASALGCAGFNAQLQLGECAPEPGDDTVPPCSASNPRASITGFDGNVNLFGLEDTFNLMTTLGALSCGEAHCCTIARPTPNDERRRLICWGDDREGQTGYDPGQVRFPAGVGHLPWEVPTLRY